MAQLQKQKPKNAGLYRSGFAFVLFLFIMQLISLAIQTYVVWQIAIFLSLEVAFIIAYSFFFFSTDYGSSAKCRMALKLCFLAVVVLSACLLAYNMAFILSILGTFFFELAYMLVVFLPMFFIIFAVYFYRVAPGKLIYPAILLCIALLLLLFVTTHAPPKPFDEDYLTFLSMKALLSGSNPYNSSFSNSMYLFALKYNYTGLSGVTMTAKNELLGNLIYPALYPLVSAPFYLLINGNAAQLRTYLALQFAVFFFLLMLAVQCLLQDKEHPWPNIAVIAFLALLPLTLSSVRVPLLIALLLVTYQKIDSKYSWLFLGLCISLQELLWIPAVLLLAYSLSSDGPKKFAYNVIGMAIVFLIINSYFIAQGPTLFFNSVFTALRRPWFDTPYSFIGYTLATSYHVLESSLNLVFYSILGILAITIAYLNDKRYLGLFSIIPFLFLAHSINSYYVAFLIVQVVVLFIPAQAHKKSTLNLGSGPVRYALTCAVIVLIFVAIAAVATSHAQYAKDLNLSIDNQSMHIATQGQNNTSEVTYYSTIHYRNLSNGTLYVMVISLSKFGALGAYGLYNESIIPSPATCSSDYRCLLNVNRLDLNPHNSSYNLAIRISNSSPISEAVVLLYNANYTYASPQVVVLK